MWLFPPLNWTDRSFQTHPRSIPESMPRLALNFETIAFPARIGYAFFIFWCPPKSLVNLFPSISLQKSIKSFYRTNTKGFWKLQPRFGGSAGNIYLQCHVFFRSSELFAGLCPFFFSSFRTVRYEEKSSMDRAGGERAEQLHYKLHVGPKGKSFSHSRVYLELQLSKIALVATVQYEQFFFFFAWSGRNNKIEHLYINCWYLYQRLLLSDMLLKRVLQKFHRDLSINTSI